MTNDLTTIEGNLQEAIDRLEGNLLEKGVSASYDSTKGYFDLLDKILDIEPSIGGIMLNTALSISSPNDVVAQGIPFILSGLLSCSYDDTTPTDDDMEGYIKHGTVKIYDGNTLLDTVTTGNDGTYNYDCTLNALGVHYLKAVYDGTDFYQNCESSAITISVIAVGSISLAVDTNILSKHHSQSAVLSATVFDNNNSPVSNVPVEFFKDGVSIGTFNTDVNGVATKIYNSDGSGDVNFIAQIGNLSSSSCLIEDCTYYWDCTSDDGHWNWHSSMTRSYSSDGLTFTKNGSNGAICSKSDITLPSEFECEFTWKSGVGYSICVNAGGGGIECQVGSQIWYYLRQCAESSTNTITESNAPSNNDVFKIVRQNGEIKYYRNDVLKGTNTLSTMDYSYLELTAFASSRSSTIKDIKIKPL